MTSIAILITAFIISQATLTTATTVLNACLIIGAITVTAASTIETISFQVCWKIGANGANIS